MSLSGEENFGSTGPRGADFLKGRRWFLPAAILAVVIIGTILATVFNLRPVGAATSATSLALEIKKGESFTDVAKDLASEGLLRSRFAFEVAAIASGGAFHIQPGTYEISTASSGIEILRDITGSGAPMVDVVIPEGSNIYQIDALLAEHGVIPRGALIAFKGDGNLEGKLFPDTYEFFEGSDVSVVVEKFLDNFNEKAAPILAGDGTSAGRDLIMASILEKEVPDMSDQEKVAGILEKRLMSGVRLDIDATVCYAKQITEPDILTDCSSLTPIDFAPSSSYNSAYNTYLHGGLPPGPIGNPGTSTIVAAMHPANSPYWYYLSDPVTGKTIYAKTLAEQDVNIKKYLKE